MSSKYYTPKIEEFHEGFEYEMIPNTGCSFIILGEYPNQEFKNMKTIWATEYKKGIFGIAPVELYDNELASIRSAIEDRKIRVKYLDKEDIESLGFEYDRTSTKGQLKFYKDNVCLYYRPETHELGTFTIDPSKNEYMQKYVIDNKQVHMLIIKNKSELKKLLQQLKIIE